MKIQRYLWLVVVLVCGIVPVFAQDATPEPPKCFAFEGSTTDVRVSYYMGEGAAYYATNQFSPALESFTCIIKEIDGSYVPAYMQRALVFTALRDYEAATQDYDQALELDGNNAAAFNNRGIVFIAREKYDEALADFEAALGIEANSPLVLNNRGVIKALRGDYDGAIADFEAAIASSGIAEVVAELTREDRPSNAETPEYDPVYAQPYGLIGIVYSAKALDAYNTYLLLRPNDADRRIQSAAGSLESRFTFDLRLDDGTWLLVADFED